MNKLSEHWKRRKRVTQGACVVRSEKRLEWDEIWIKKK